MELSDGTDLRSPLRSESFKNKNRNITSRSPLQVSKRSPLDTGLPSRPLQQTVLHHTFKIPVSHPSPS